MYSKNIIRQVSIFLLLTASVLAHAAAPYVDRRAPTGEDIAQAQAALEAFVPEDHREYLLGETGYGYKGDQFAAFSTRLPNTTSAVSRTKRVTCSRASRQSDWRYYGPTVDVFAYGHNFPQPQDIDDQTIADVANFMDSRCLREQAQSLEQAGKWFGPPLRGTRFLIRALKRAEGDAFIVTVGSRSSGNLLTVSRDPSAPCGMRLHGGGYYVE